MYFNDKKRPKLRCTCVMGDKHLRLTPCCFVTVKLKGRVVVAIILGLVSCRSLISIAYILVRYIAEGYMIVHVPAILNFYEKPFPGSMCVKRMKIRSVCVILMNRFGFLLDRCLIKTFLCSIYCKNALPSQGKS